MARQPWQRYVMALCKEAWHLDGRSTEEVVRCIEDLLAAESVGQATAVQVFLGAGVHAPSAGRATKTVRIRISSGVAGRNTFGETHGPIVARLRQDTLH